MHLLKLSRFSGLFFLLIAKSSSAYSDGYHLPWSGNASTTQFSLGPELSSGTSCGVKAWAKNATYGNPPAGGGPGFLYAAINQLAFGANPSDPKGGGPGAACGICFKLTPISGSGRLLHSQALTFKVIDECPAALDTSNPNGGLSQHCGMCNGQVNDYGQQWHFDIAVDAMNKHQYNTFFNGTTDDKNWRAVSFTQSCCTKKNPDPPIASWGCLNNCTNNDAAHACNTPSLPGPNTTSLTCDVAMMQSTTAACSPLPTTSSNAAAGGIGPTTSSGSLGMGAGTSVTDVSSTNTRVATAVPTSGAALVRSGSGGLPWMAVLIVLVTTSAMKRWP
ncbi:hypothetical protein MMC13_002435 [Lambiella insularis]|nr:hypothetical protein [Lambiella insularis]